MRNGKVPDPNKAPDPNKVHPIPGYENEVYVRPTVTRPNIVVGDFTYIADSEFESHVTHHYEWNGDRLIIGKFCQIAAGVEFVMNGANHQMNAVSTFPFYTLEGWEMDPPARADLPLKGDTVIGNDVWIGQDAVILPGVHVGDGAIVGANSVVGSDVEPYAIVVGNPAKVLRKRFDDELIGLLLAFRWWDKSVDEINALIPILTCGDLEKVRKELSTRLREEREIRGEDGRREGMDPNESQEDGRRYRTKRHRMGGDVRRRMGGDEAVDGTFFSVEDHAFLVAQAKGEGDAAELARLVLAMDITGFGNRLEKSVSTSNKRFSDPEFRRVALLGLELGVALEDGVCANYLGALYYMGDVVGQDYERAEELYQMADRQGLAQGMVNLGYIYEYGRVGEPDHLRAYMQYAKAAAVAGHFEALYKMGDMYARGRLGEADLRVAFALYDRSLREAEGVAAQAQPAFRIAELISNPRNADLGIPYDPMGALSLYQLAERGLRICVAHGETYYRKRLRQAMEGQARMREVLDDPAFWEHEGEW